jgi:hypothetical protein
MFFLGVPAHVTYCYSVGTVVGSANMGGLVGGNYQGRVEYSYARGDVTGVSCVGGLLGYHITGEAGGDIFQCYSASVVSGERNVGGLVAVTDPYYPTTFWDIEASGQTSSGCGTGVTTTEMQDPNTFIAAGWDFIDETKNGTDDIWWILEGHDYPRLWWELETQ